MDSGRHLDSGTRLYAAPISVSLRSGVPEYSRREDVDDPVLLVSSHDSLDSGTKWDDLFCAFRQCGIAVSSDVPEKKAHHCLVGVKISITLIVSSIRAD